MIKYVAFVFFLLSVKCEAQFTITGKIVGQVDKKPVSYATVFLNNTSSANMTDDNGAFTLYNVRPGHYQLLVSSIGFETYKTNVVINDNMVLADIELVASTQALQEVQVKAKFRLSSHFQRI